MANIEQATASDNQLLEKVMSKEKYEILKSYNIKIALFYKYGKRDKEGNLKTTALSKNGVPIPAQTKIVSSFNRITDNTDVKIILNKELWDELSQNEKEWLKKLEEERLKVEQQEKAKLKNKYRDR